MELVEELKKICKHKNVEITDRCNSAIFIAMQMVSNSEKKKILIPDQGGWFSYKKYPKFFGLEIVEVKTDYGVIDIKDLEEKSKDCCGFIFTSFAGYFAEQDLKKISEVCRNNGCLVIEDASGAIGDEILCNGEYSDIIVGSFGHWKPVNCGYGGFISSNLEIKGEALSMIKVYEGAYDEMYDALKNNKLPKLLELSKKVKDDLKEFDILYREKRGVNVVVRKNPKIIEYCKEKGYPFVECPNYIRVNEEAISIELKRLDI
ncbi:MAG: DegT/DnrJ/EryC1/StrS family aminotransferase [Nanoarchaeota archaeon]|nr:DegT/DnrJ/EryC1/StrS family aminotransferase [Nanoarchaeota archaeon]